MSEVVAMLLVVKRHCLSPTIGGILPSSHLDQTPAGALHPAPVLLAGYPYTAAELLVL